MAKRPGTKAARQKFGPVGVSNLRADAPLDLLQIVYGLSPRAQRILRGAIA